MPVPMSMPWTKLDFDIWHIHNEDMNKFPRGTTVTVKTFGGYTLERIVWEDLGLGVLVCTEEAFTNAQRDGGEPSLVGFPREDVTPPRSRKAS